VLRKGCSDSCILRPCLQWIENADAQGHATVFVAKFFGRAGLMGFISAVPDGQRPALFQSLLYEACGRTVNPVFGAVGLLSTGNWHLCREAVETVLRGGTLQPSPLRLLSSSLPPGFMNTTGLEKSVVAKEMQESRIPSVVPLHPPPQLFNHEFYKPRSFEVGFLDRNLQQAWGLEEQQYNNVHSGMRGDLNGNKGRVQELQQHRMMQGNALHLSTWPRAIRVSLYPSKDQTCLEVKDEQALGLSYKHRDVREVGMEHPEAVGPHSTVVLAPVARRVKPRLSAEEHTTGNQLSKLEPQEIPAGGLGLNDGGGGNQPELELNLTLKVQDAKGGSPAAGLQVSSPSCESVISEGSVTSHSSQLVPLQPPSTSWALERPFPAVVLPPPLHHKLLPLLL
jgi:hypothetical protein